MSAPAWVWLMLAATVLVVLAFGRWLTSLTSPSIRARARARPQAGMLAALAVLCVVSAVISASTS